MKESKEDLDIPEDIAGLIPDVAVETPGKETNQDIREQMDDELNAQSIISRAESIPSAPVAINGIFQHPPEFTPQEWEIIISGLKAHLPLFLIARKVHCERHFLSRKIRERQEVAQVALDAREGMVDIAESQLVKAAQQGSMAASIYILDHQGRDRGWGEQTENKDTAEDVQIVLGEIPQSEIDKANKIIEEANNKVTPTLAKELADKEKTQSPTAQQMAFAEDIMRTMNQEPPKQPVDITPDVQSVSPSPYDEGEEANSKYDFLDNVFSEGGDSPFNLL